MKRAPIHSTSGRFAMLHRIGRGLLDLPSFHLEFDQQFALGIDPDSTQAPKDEQAEWPAVEDVLDYLKRVHNRLDEYATPWTSCIRCRTRTPVESAVGLRLFVEA